MKKISTMIKRKEVAFLCCCLFLLILIENSICSSSNQHGPGDNDIHFIHREIDFLRNENEDQNIQIAVLKDMMIKLNQHDESFIQELDRRMKEHHPRRLKRPYRLLPIDDRKSDDSDDSNEHHSAVRRFYGPPSNCSDLMKLGYTLNGFFLVKPDLNSLLDDANIRTVYCSFNQQEGVFDLSKIERQVSSLKHANQSKGRGVHFQAIAKNIPYRIVSNSKYQNLFFQETSLNMGDAFNKSTGFFTAPKSGVYKFLFQMTLSLIEKNDIEIELYHRSLKEISSEAPGTVVRSTLIDSENQMLQYGLIDTTIKLNQGEIIYLRIVPRWWKITENIDLLNPILFSGSLLEEVQDTRSF